MSGLTSVIQLISPQWQTTSPTAPTHREEASRVEEPTSSRDCASDIDSQRQDHRQPLPYQQQIPPDVHKEFEHNRRLKHMLEEAKKANTSMQRDISIPEASLRELSVAPEHQPQYPTASLSHGSIWTLMPDEILYGSGLISPFLPPPVRHEARRTRSLSSPRQPRLNNPLQSQGPAPGHVSSPQPPPLDMNSPESMGQRLSPRAPLPVVISTENVDMRSSQCHGAPPDLSVTRTKYTVTRHRHGPQVKWTQRSAKPSPRRLGTLHQRHVTSAPLVQAMEPRMTTALLLELPEMIPVPKDRGLENPRLGDPASLWCRYYSHYRRQIPLPEGIRRTRRGAPKYNHVVGWRAIVCLRPPGGIHLEASTTTPYVLFAEALMTLFSGSESAQYSDICQRLGLQLVEHGVLLHYKGPFLVDSLIEEVAKHLNNCGVTFQFAKRYIAPFVRELKRQRGYT